MKTRSRRVTRSTHGEPRFHLTTGETQLLVRLLHFALSPQNLEYRIIPESVLDVRQTAVVEEAEGLLRLHAEALRMQGITPDSEKEGPHAGYEE